MTLNSKRYVVASLLPSDSLVEIDTFDHLEHGLERLKQLMVADPNAEYCLVDTQTEKRVFSTR